MTLYHFLIDVAGGIFGILLHIFLVKLPGHKQKCLAGNHPFSAKQYFKDDWVALVGAFITVLAVTYFLDEAIRAYPKLLDFVKFFMVFIGFTGSSLLVAVMGTATKKVMNVIDEKTNIADGK